MSCGCGIYFGTPFNLNCPRPFENVPHGFKMTGVGVTEVDSAEDLIVPVANVRTHTAPWVGAALP